MTSLAAKIKSRAHWQVLVRPTEFIEDRGLSRRQLEDAVRRSSVNLRGWDYPHWDTGRPPKRASDAVGQEFERDCHVEMWRAFKSGQVAILTGVWGDWREGSAYWPPDEGVDPRATIMMEALIYRLTEVYEFAARWASGPLEVDAMEIVVRLRNVAGKRLIRERRAFMSSEANEIGVPQWEHNRVVTVAELLATSTDLAIAPCRDLLDLFRVELSPDGVRAYQENLVFWHSRLDHGERLTT